MNLTRSVRDRPSRSSLQTTSVSPGFSARRTFSSPGLSMFEPVAP